MDFLERLGFKSNPWVEQQGGKGFFLSISREYVNKLDADLMNMGVVARSCGHGGGSVPGLAVRGDDS
ncbi:hypothetical protein [Streptomyces sp. NPDC059262]|uniref:hypothetical protein n=1 Tax=Streptomyces sp. NPDC059262 TaxID=3346797 RepID=UPI0036C4D45C